VSSARTLVAVSCRRKLLSIHRNMTHRNVTHRNVTHRNVLSQLKERRTHVSGARSRFRNWRSTFRRSTMGALVTRNGLREPPKVNQDSVALRVRCAFSCEVPELVIHVSSLHYGGACHPKRSTRAPKGEPGFGGASGSDSSVGRRGEFPPRCRSPIRHAGRVRAPAVSGDGVGSASSRGEAPPC
jgi:hypothetical protein